MPDAARAVNRNPPDSSRSTHQSPVSTSSNALRHFIDGSLSFVFSAHTCRIQCDVSMTLTTTTHSPQQLMAVWNLRLHSDSEGPTFISSTALKAKRTDFYIRTSDSIRDTRWWRQMRQALVRSVVPPSAQACRWCPSDQRAGRSQPGKLHP